MKILAINGSGRGKGNTRKLLEALSKEIPSDIQYEIVDLNRLNFAGCIGCEGCATSNRCIIQDDMQELYPLIDAASGLVLGSPTYYYNVTSKMKAFIERLYPYQVFDGNDRSIWSSVNEISRVKYALTIAVCEQNNEVDMGFTSEALSMPLEALGYRVVSKETVLNLFERNAAEDSDKILNQMSLVGLKLYKTIKLVNR